MRTDTPPTALEKQKSFLGSLNFNQRNNFIEYRFGIQWKGKKVCRNSQAQIPFERNSTFQ